MQRYNIVNGVEYVPPGKFETPEVLYTKKKSWTIFHPTTYAILTIDAQRHGHYNKREFLGTAVQGLHFFILSEICTREMLS